MAELLQSLYHNATMFAGTVISASKPIGGLYPDIDIATLNVFEQAWVAWYSYFDSPVVATGVMSFLMHEVGSLDSSLHGSNLFFLRDFFTSGDRDFNMVSRDANGLSNE
jgi:hypothetical protein